MAQLVPTQLKARTTPSGTLFHCFFQNEVCLSLLSSGMFIAGQDVFFVKLFAQLLQLRVWLLAKAQIQKVQLLASVCNLSLEGKRP